MIIAVNFPIIGKFTAMIILHSQLARCYPKSENSSDKKTLRVGRMKSARDRSRNSLPAKGQTISLVTVPRQYFKELKFVSRHTHRVHCVFSEEIS